MLSKREFLVVYEEAVGAIKQIKLYNDKLNKKLGVSSTHNLLRESEVETEVVTRICDKVQQNIDRMEKSYLDPQTARKIGTVKQQLRSQKDRRRLLLQNLQQLSFTDKKTQETHPSKTPKQQMSLQMRESHFSQSLSADRSKNSERIQKQDRESETAASNSQVMMEISDFDYELERKLMHEKNLKIGETHEQFNRVKGLMDQTSALVDEQGDMIDIISDDLFTSYKNTVIANTEIHEANSNQRRLRSKTCLLILCLCCTMAVTLYIYFYLL